MLHMLLLLLLFTKLLKPPHTDHMHVQTAVLIRIVGWLILFLSKQRACRLERRPGQQALHACMWE